MQQSIEHIFAESIAVKQATLAKNAQAIAQAAQLLIDAFKSGNKILLCGNGGSAADSQHIAAEFVGRFQKERAAWPAIALTVDTSALTALCNDYTFDIVFARQVQALGKKGDVLIGISTSGNSKNVIKALETARTMGLKTIGVTGGNGGAMLPLCDIALVASSSKTARIQESHLVMFHALCELVENALA